MALELSPAEFYARFCGWAARTASPRSPLALFCSSRMIARRGLWPLIASWKYRWALQWRCSSQSSGECRKVRDPMSAQKEENARLQKDRIGLCATCQHTRRVQSDRGAVFYRCARAAVDPRFKKYPPLPVLQCAGYEPGPAVEPGPDYFSLNDVNICAN